MSAGGSGAIGPVSVRYAAQIRELLFAQAMQRAAADQEAARVRAETERTAQIEAAAKAETARQPLEARVPAPEFGRHSAPAAPAEAEPDARPSPPPASQHLVDIQA